MALLKSGLFLNDDGHSRRDYVFIYTGPNLAAAVKGRFKRIWAGAQAGLSGAEFYDLYDDPREEHGLMIPMFNVKSSFNHQRQRHESWMQKYPNRPGPIRGPVLTDIDIISDALPFGRLWDEHEIGKAAAAFLLELIARLQVSGTVPMIDVRAYTRWLAR
jgi:hypothetical protein